VAFDLKAATDAAITELERAPFEFDWGTEHFAIPPIKSWPLAVSAGFAKFGDQNPDDINPSEVLGLLEQIIGADYERFAHTVPMDAMPILVTEMAKQQMGTDLGGSLPPPEPASTLT
jgi:hypothetical protein